MPTLFVKCRACGTDFPTRIGEPKTGVPGGVIISGLKLRCPKCGKEDQYSTQDFHVPVDTTGPPGGGRAKAEPNPTSEHEGHEEAAQQKEAGHGVVPPEDRPPGGG